MTGATPAATSLTAPQPEGPPSRAIITPLVDTICVGGAWLVAVAWLLSSGLKFDKSSFAPYVTLQVLINYPHFMASYRLLYQSRAVIDRYKFAAIYLPIALLGYTAFAALYSVGRAAADIDMRYFWFIDYLVAINLAIHYTGQAWGMTASFAYIGNVALQPVERKVLRASFYSFMVWHIATYHHHIRVYDLFMPWLAPAIPWAYKLATIGAQFGMLAGIATYVRISRRIGRPAPLRMALPMLALYLGYVFYQLGNATLFVLQLGHALQYLIFPLRVEINRNVAASDSVPRRSLHLAIYAVLLVASGWLAFLGTGKLPGTTAWFTSLVFVDAINLHHYFIDQSVWKISTPEVRKDLFRHLAPAS
jgi:hypothetical protein